MSKQNGISNGTREVRAQVHRRRAGQKNAWQIDPIECYVGDRIVIAPSDAEDEVFLISIPSEHADKFEENVHTCRFCDGRAKKKYVIGRGGNRTFRLKAKKPGKIKYSFYKLKPRWEADPDPIEVEVDPDITIRGRG